MQEVDGEGSLERDVHDALRWLYDNVALGQSALAARFPELSRLPKLEERGSRLRRILLNAIESLRPERRCPFGSLESRSYDVLTLRYVENRKIAEMARELSLSDRQVHRDLLRAEQALAALLRSHLQSSAQPTSDNRKDLLADELRALGAELISTELGRLLEEVRELVEPLAAGHGCQVCVRLDERAQQSTVLAAPSLLKLLLVQLISYALQAAAPGPVELVAHSGAQEVLLRLSFERRAEGGDRALKDCLALARAQGMNCSFELSGDSRATITLCCPLSRPRVALVVEDNPDAVLLYRRYLQPAGWQVQSIVDPRLTWEVAKRLKPDVIILDIMMPKMDGWTVLRALSRDDQTQRIPVIVCSVLQDEELSKSLGARRHLTKPVGQGELLAAICECTALR